jgi:hypothetical protein
MADTVVKFNVEAGKDFFHVYDNTGSYGKKNKTGWGSPNDKISDVSGAEVRIYLPGENTYTGVDVFPNLPNTDCVGLEIIPNDIGMGTFPPGVYRFEYVISLTNGLTLAESCYLFFDEPLKCCISKKRMATDLNDASSPEAKNVIELEALLRNAQWCACSGKMDCAQDISDYIWTNCGCCC